MKSNLSVFFLFVVGLLNAVSAFPQPNLDSRLNRTRRDASCRSEQEYLSGNICCLNCPAGTYVKKPCTKEGTRGQCEECEYPTFIEHASHLTQCFKCTQPRSDQVIVKQCTSTQNAEFECKPGKFCHPDEACEVCRKCSKCKNDEEIARNCTPTTNTECKKIQPKPGSASETTLVVWLPFVLVGVVAAIFGLVVFLCRRRQRETNSNRDQSDATKADSLYVSPIGEIEDVGTRRSSVNLILSHPLVRVRSLSCCPEEERRILGDSPNSSASNSQHSLICLPTTSIVPVLSAGVRPAAAASAAAPELLPLRREENFPKLIPVKGEESLRACFEYFEELNVDHYKRFFRSLGISDNDIKSKDSLNYVDRLHELLGIWVEKVGRDASLNQLLKALLELSQRLTAENIKDRAVQNGHYYCED